MLAWIMPRALRVRAVTVLLFAAALVFRAAASAAEGRWMRIDSSHFSVLTDADEKRGHEVAVRFEQMRALFAQLLMKSRVNLSAPIEIIAFKDDAEYERAAPARPGAGLGAGFFVPGEDRTYFVLNLAREESWRAVFSDFARVLLGFNYPPTQAWFEEGFVECFSTLHLTDHEMRSSGDPSRPLVAVLSGANWLDLAQLFRQNPDGLNENQRTMFRAESWIVLDYLLHKNQLPALGTYFGLVENEKLGVDDALQKAFGMGSAGLEQAVKDYFRSLSGGLAAQGNNAPTPADTTQTASLPAATIGSSTHPIPEPEARALLAEMKLRVPDHRAEARRELASIVDQASADSAIAHRALAWDLLEQKQYAQAEEELGKAMALDAKEPWTHYYLAIAKFQDAQANRGEVKGLANMIQDLHIVLDWDHEFAEAYHLLALAQLEGGGLHAATDSIRAAIALAPRKPGYLLDLARIYEAGKNWDSAAALLERLSRNSDPQIASAAQKAFEDLPYVKKYGVPPLSASSSPPAASAPPPSGGSLALSPAKNRSPGAAGDGSTSSQAGDNAGGGNEEATTSPEPQVDHRPIQFRKGKLLSVDCSQAPAAMVTVTIAAKTMKLRTTDYKALMLIGADSFSCDWTNLAVSVNYRAGGQADGDLVSLEVH